MRLEFLENGPIRVEAEGEGFQFQGPQGEEILAKKVVFLCRCGGSGRKPFCDGTHRKLGFEAPGGKLSPA